MRIQAGDLRHLVAVVKVVRGDKDSEGNRTESDTTVCTLWAAVKDAGNKESYDADARQMEDVVNFTVRWMTEIEPGMVVVHAGTRHEIKRVDQLSHQRDFMIIKTNRRTVTA